jgi:hypothetical protein
MAKTPTNNSSSVNKGLQNPRIMEKKALASVIQNNLEQSAINSN